MSDIDECSICLEPLDNKYQKYLLECKHQFHTTCLNDWYKNPKANYKCPMCNIPSDIINVSKSETIMPEIINTSPVEKPENTTLNNYNHTTIVNTNPTNNRHTIPTNKPLFKSTLLNRNTENRNTENKKCVIL